MNKGTVVDLTQGSPTKLITQMSIPIILASVLQQLYTTVDAIIIGRFLGADALAAVGLSFPVIYLLYGVIMGICMGLTIIVAQYFGAKQFDDIKRAISTAFIFLTIVTILLSILGWVFSEQILSLLGTPTNLISQSASYLKIIFAGSFMVLVYNLYSALLRGVGDTKSPLYFLLIASALNIILDLLFIGVFHWGVQGAAVATVASQAIASVFCLVYVAKKVPMVSVNIKEYHFDKETLSLVLRFGLPSAFVQSALALSMLFMQTLVNSFGAATIAGYTAATKVDAYLTMPYIGMGHAVAGFTGQNIGANQFDRIKKGTFSAIKVIAIVSIILVPLILLFGSSFISLFLDANATEARSVGIQYLKDLAPFYLVLGIGHMMLGTLRGAGDNSATMTINII